jgi:phospholipid N-methyltransferase
VAERVLPHVSPANKTRARARHEGQVRRGRAWRASSSGGSAVGRGTPLAYKCRSAFPLRRHVRRPVRLWMLRSGVPRERRSSEVGFEGSGSVLIGLAFGRDEEPWQDSSPRAGAACRSPRKGQMKTNVAERLIFLRAFGTHPRLVGAVVPTSRWAVVDMLDMADIQGAKSVVELGAGTGVFTQEILARLRQDARVVALERDPRLAGLLTKRFQDPRLEVKCGSAEDLKSHLDGMTVDVVVSSLPFTSLKSDVRDRILEQVMQALAPKGVALVLQYTPIIQCQLRRLFPSVKRRVSLLNVPPAFLFACSMRKPTGAANGGRCQ